jgi:hypothetical protein
MTHTPRVELVRPPPPPRLLGPVRAPEPRAPQPKRRRLVARPASASEGAKAQVRAPALRNIVRGHRTRSVRAQTIPVNRISKQAWAALRAEQPDANQRRLPMLRAECERGPRPCPYISCAHHLFLDVSPDNGAIKINFPDLIDDEGGIEFAAMPETCALDVADDGKHTLERVAELMNLTRESIRQMAAQMRNALRQHPILFDTWRDR